MVHEEEYKEFFKAAFFNGLFPMKETFETALKKYCNDVYDKKRTILWLKQFMNESMSPDEFEIHYFDDLVHRYLYSEPKLNPFVIDHLDIEKRIGNETDNQLELYVELETYLYSQGHDIMLDKVEKGMIQDNLIEYNNILIHKIPKRLERLNNRINSETPYFQFNGSQDQKELLFHSLKCFIYDNVEYNFISSNAEWKDFDKIFSDSHAKRDSSTKPINWIAISNYSKEYNLISIHDLLYSLQLYQLVPKSELAVDNGYIDKIDNWFKRGDGNRFNKQSIRKSNPKDQWKSANSEYHDVIFNLVQSIG